MALFGPNKTDVAVLESKFEIYEQVSKEMLDKLDRAVNTISENSNRVAIILERHEGKLNESARTDQIIIEMINELKENNINENKLSKEKVEKIELKIQELSKFRWMTIGIGTAAVLIIKSYDFFGSILSLPKTPLTTQTIYGTMVEEVVSQNVLR
tara:strand:- start:1635 stop:2099 length:465 start_codon:yes stop_codon:yes gene_type:complete